MIRQHPAKDLQRIGHIAHGYALRDVGLMELTSKRSLPLSAGMPPELQMSMRDEAGATLLDEGSTLSVHVRFEIRLHPNDQGPESALLVVAGVFSLRYDRIVSALQVTAEDAAAFARINGTYNAWPYIREVASSTAARLGCLGITLDSLVIAAVPEPASSTVAE